MKKIFATILNQMYEILRNITPDQYLVIFVSAAIKLSYGFLFLSGLFFCSVILDIFNSMKKGESLKKAITDTCFFCHLFRMMIYFILLYIGAWTIALCDGDDIYFRLVFYGVMYLEIIVLDSIYQQISGKSFIQIFRNLIKEKISFGRKNKI